MNAIDLARTAYSTGSPTVKTPASVEYDAFLRVTRQLRATCREDAAFADLAAAISDNRRLWTLIAASVGDPENRLPDDLKARLFYLSEFTREHSRAVLNGKDSVEPLVEINSAIMQGLRAQTNAA